MNICFAHIIIYNILLVYDLLLLSNKTELLKEFTSYGNIDQVIEK